MNTPINKDNLSFFAYTNAHLMTEKPRGIVVEFHGLGGGRDLIREDWPLSKFLAERGVLYVIPYYGPWAWMSDKSVRYTDEVLDALFDGLELDPDTPIVSSGYSMGGQGALVYCRYARRTPSACAAISPVCDLPYHYTERPDLPRTMYSALYNNEGTLEDALKSISPLHLAPKMPDIPYTIFHCNKDRAVNIDMHSEKLVAALKAAGKDVTYHIVPDMGHCDLTPEMYELYRKYLIDAILTK